MKLFTGHEQEMECRNSEVWIPLSKKSLEQIKKRRLEELRKNHPSKSEIWDLLDEEAKKELINKIGI